MKNSKNLISLLVLAGAPIFSYGADACSAADVKQIAIDVNTSAIKRASAPKELFGFNVPWRDFQLGYVRNGVVRSDLYPFLAPFKGAVYRYPGGTPSNAFEWTKSVGPTAKRVPMLADFENVSKAEFGIDEFATFVNTVGGRALLTLNISGTTANPRTVDVAKNDAIGLLNYIRTTSPFKCVAGATCGLMAVELGNELDLSASNWPAANLVTRSNAVVDAVNATPGLSGITWVANGRTAPWGGKDFVAFNETLAAGLTKTVQGIAIHPYYDGIDIPFAMAYVNSFGATWTSKRSDGKIFVTEHARWPTVPTTGAWQTNWYQATGIGGAISAADFLMALVGQPQVAEANWHALGLSGPWQLIRVNKTTDALYPSPVYWALLTAREAYLDNLVTTKYSPPAVKATYSGGYDVKFMGMSAADGSSASVIGINRNPVPYKINITWSAGSRKAGSGILRTVSSPLATADNTDAAPTQVTMVKSSQTLAGGRVTSSWCVPAQAVFSIVEP